MPGTTVTPATPHDLLIAVRDVVRNNPERHDQGTWLDSVFRAPLIRNNPERHDQGTWLDSVFRAPLIRTTTGLLRKYARLPIPEQAADPDNPVCGTTACVAGWAVILGADPDTEIGTQGYDCVIMNRATELLGLTQDQADVLFSSSASREQVLENLDALIANPGARLWYEEEDEDWYEDEDEDEDWYEDEDEDE